MIKKYLLDIISIVLVSAVALLATQKPATELKLRPSSPSIGDKGKLPDVKKGEKEKVRTGIIKEVAALGSLKERNIFSPDGSYTKSGAGLKGPLPENPYTLIGILNGEEKKAVFRDHTGSIIALTVGKKLIDGSVITKIEKLSVQLENEKGKKELKVFDLTDPKRRTPSKPGIAPKPERSPKPETPPRPERGSRRRPTDRETPQEPELTPRQRPRP
jgi:hypothetical protein